MKEGNEGPLAHPLVPNEVGYYFAIKVKELRTILTLNKLRFPVVAYLLLSVLGR